MVDGSAEAGIRRGGAGEVKREIANREPLILPQL